MNRVSGSLLLVLHTHMPYVRKNGVFPVGEDWLYQVMSRTYLPLIRLLEELEISGRESCMALTMTPVLCEQLADEHIRRGFAEYLETMAGRAEDDARDFAYFSDPQREQMARGYAGGFREQSEFFEEIERDITGAIGRYCERGIIEAVSCSATHAFLQNQSEFGAVEHQVRLGIDSHRRHLGSNPRGFWIPELSYRSGLESVLESEGLSYMVVDFSSLGKLPRWCAYLAGESGVSAVPRSERAHMNVWDYRRGYPTHGDYMDTTRYYQGSGLLYWRVTGLEVPIEEKEIYVRSRGTERALEHAGHFLEEVGLELAEAPRCGESGETEPVVCACYDTEFFGHGWHEGFDWLRSVISRASSDDSLHLTTPAAYLEENPPDRRAELVETTWTDEHDDSSWVNPETEWMWSGLRGAQGRFAALRASGAGREPDSLTGRALDQAARELLLLESSDWPFMVARDRAKEYATQRFEAHLERFNMLADAIERATLEENTALLDGIEEVDRLFEWLDFRRL